MKRSRGSHLRCGLISPISFMSCMGDVGYKGDMGVCSLKDLFLFQDTAS